MKTCQKIIAVLLCITLSFSLFVLSGFSEATSDICLTASEEKDGIITVSLTLVNCVGLTAMDLQIENYGKLEPVTFSKGADVKKIEEFYGESNKLTGLFGGYFRDYLYESENWIDGENCEGTVNAENFEVYVIKFTVKEDTEVIVSGVLSFGDTKINVSKKITLSLKKIEPKVILTAGEELNGVTPVSVLFVDCIGLTAFNITFEANENVTKITKKSGKDAKNTDEVSTEFNNNTGAFAGYFKNYLYSTEDWKTKEGTEGEINGESFEIAVFHITVDKETEIKINSTLTIDGKDYNFSQKCSLTCTRYNPKLNITVLSRNFDGFVPVLVQFTDAVSMSKAELTFTYENQNIKVVLSENGQDAKVIKNTENPVAFTYTHNKTNGVYTISFADTLWDAQKWASAEGVSGVVNAQAFEASVLKLAVIGSCKVSVSGTVTMGGQTLPVQTEFSVTGVKIGDVDNNGKLDAGDARLVLRAAVSLEKFNEVQKAAADVDQNGVIDATDARLILRGSVGLEKFYDDHVQR